MSEALSVVPGGLYEAVFPLEPAVIDVVMSAADADLNYVRQAAIALPSRDQVLAAAADYLADMLDMAEVFPNDFKAGVALSYALCEVQADESGVMLPELDLKLADRHFEAVAERTDSPADYVAGLLLSYAFEMPYLTERFERYAAQRSYGEAIDDRQRTMIQGAFTTYDLLSEHCRMLDFERLLED